MENREIQNKNSWRNTEKGRYIKNCFTVTEGKQSKTYDIRLTYPSDTKNVVLLNQLFSYLHRHRILARKASRKGYYISIPLKRDHSIYIPISPESDFDKDLTIEDVENAINDFAMQQRKLFVTENGQMEDLIWCIFCNKGYKDLEDFLVGDIYNNQYGMLCDACCLEDEERVEEEVERMIDVEKLEKDWEEELKRQQDDEESELETEEDDDGVK